MSDLVAEIHARLVDDGGGVDDIDALIRSRAPLLSSAEVAALHAEIAARLTGLGSLDPLLRDPAITEIMVNGPGPVWVERDGGVEPAGITIDRGELDVVIERIVAPIGRRIDPLRPWVDGRLADGSRVSIVAEPVAVDGPYLTIRRFRERRPGLVDFVDDESCDLPERLRTAVIDGATVVVSGGTGAGKTSLLNALAAEIGPDTRVITVEDAAELSLGLPHVVRLESRPAGIEGEGAVDFRDLVRAALRMRPDRLVVGEVRGAEAFDLMQALNTGHRGGMTTVHANAPADALRRLLMLVLSADTGVPAEVVSEQLVAAIDLVVQVARGPGTSRRIVDVVTVHHGMAVEPW